MIINEIIHSNLILFFFNSELFFDEQSELAKNNEADVTFSFKLTFYEYHKLSCTFVKLNLTEIITINYPFCVMQKQRRNRRI